MTNKNLNQIQKGDFIMAKVYDIAKINASIPMVVDSGKMNSKGYAELNGTEITSVFRTNVVETNQIAHEEFRVVYADKTYSVGDSNHAIDPNHLKTEKNIDMHVISTLKMITELIDKMGLPRVGLKIHLGVNMPIKQYLEPSLRTSFENLYRANHSIKVSDREYSFEVTDVEVNAEGLGILFLNPAKFKNRRFVVCDNGGLNSSFIQVDNMRPMSGSDSLQTGVHTLCLEIDKKLSHKGLKHEQIIDILEDNGKTYKDEEIEKVVSECLAAHVKSIYTSLDSVSRAALTDYLFTGGASSIYKKELEKYFPHVEFSENGLFDNAKGFYKKLESTRRRAIKNAEQA